MALKLDYNVELQYELKTATDTLVNVEKTKTEYTQVKDCYVKIVDIIPAVSGGTPAYAGNEETGSLVRYNVYNADKTALITRGEVNGFVPSTKETAPNIVKQAYAFLKTQPTFLTAQDVLEEGQSGAYLYQNS